MEHKGRDLEKGVADVLDKLVELGIINYSNHDRIYFYVIPETKDILVLDYFFQNEDKDLPKNVLKRVRFKS